MISIDDLLRVIEDKEDFLPNLLTVRVFTVCLVEQLGCHAAEISILARPVVAAASNTNYRTEY